MTKNQLERTHFEPDSSLEQTPIPLFEGAMLMSWSTKGLPHPTGGVDIAMGVCCLLPISFFLYGCFGDPTGTDRSDIKILGMFGLCLWLFFWKAAVRQKNVYQMRITEVGGQANYWINIPERVDILLKWIAGISLFLVVCMIAVMPSAIWLLAGPGGMAILASQSLLRWKRIIHYTRFKWDQLNWIVIDRKRGLVVFTAHWDASKTFEEQYVCFEAFVPTDQIEELIQIAKLHAPSSTHFEQCHWDGCNE